MRYFSWRRCDVFPRHPQEPQGVSKIPKRRDHPPAGVWSLFLRWPAKINAHGWVALKEVKKQPRVGLSLSWQEKMACCTFEPPPKQYEAALSEMHETPSWVPSHAHDGCHDVAPEFTGNVNISFEQQRSSECAKWIPFQQGWTVANAQKQKFAFFRWSAKKRRNVSTKFKIYFMRGRIGFKEETVQTYNC